MGKKDKKKHRHRSRSRDREEDRHKSSKSRKRSSSNESDSSQESSKRHKGKHRHRSRDRQTGDSHKHSQSPPRVLTHEEMELVKERKRREKEMAKALETPEEKRARRLLKKEGKERKRKAQMGWDDEYLGYSNIDNPFGDEHLLDTFHWGKKLEKAGIKGAPVEQIEKLQKHKMIENKIELEKVKKRRQEREREREERDKERETLQRQKEAEYYREWEEQEDNFHLHQAKMRSKIRIDDGRAKPIDLLAHYIDAESDDLAVEMHEPYTYLNGLTTTDLEDLIEDIKVYVELEQGQNVDYWRDITIICEEELSKLRKLDPDSRDYIGERRSGINTSVAEDVNTVFKGKSLSQLGMLGEQIMNKLKGGEGVDVGYWESLLQQLKAHMATTRLRERHQEQLRRKLFKLKQEQGIESEPLFPIASQDGPAEPDPEPPTSGQPDDDEQPGTSSQGAAAPGPEEESMEGVKGEEEEEEGEEEEAVLTEEDLHNQSYVDYDSGRYSPRLLQVRDLEPDTLVYDPEDDIKRLEFARIQLKQTGQAKKDSDIELLKRAKAGMNEEESQFSVEMKLGEQTLLWSDKYRPRKPRFFNRVHTGFEWNKYNQTHYDIDNPPPKIVQGYKFNIFYPDLIDKTNTPEYILTPLEDNKDFAMLRFKSGPPYEDIAFKIVNREWEYSYKRGFRCQFQNNIFQLWFHFKRYRYRR